MSSLTDEDVAFEEFERGRLEMERTWYLRQENILPLERARNEGRFYGLLLKGSQPFTGFQRCAILVFGLQIAGTGLLVFLMDSHLMPHTLSLRTIYRALPDVPLSWLALLPVVFLNFLFGSRLCWVATKRPPTHIHVEE